MMMEVWGKRSSFHDQVRKKQIATTLTQMRLNISTQEQKQILSCIIKETQSTQQITKKQIALLAKWGLCGDQAAIAHLGNSIIDGIIDDQKIKQIQQMTIQQQRTSVVKWIGCNDKYLWILNILYQKNMFNQKYLEQLITIINKKIINMQKLMCLSKLEPDSYLHQHGLLVLRKVLKQHDSALCLLLQNSYFQLMSQLFKSIQKLILVGSHTKIIWTCLSILNLFCSLRKMQNTGGVFNIFKICNLQSIVNVSFSRIESTLRCLSVQIVNNIWLNYESQAQSLVLMSIQPFLKSWRNQKRCVKLQLSYLFSNFSQNCSVVSLRYLILHHNLLDNLVYFTQTNTNENRNQQFTNNIFLSLRSIFHQRYVLQFDAKDAQLSWILFSQKFKSHIRQWQINNIHLF